MAGIYLHVPFCVKKCLYCDFVSFPDMSRAQDYFDALYEEISMAAAMCCGKKFDTVFFGGGTPSAVPPEFICGAMERITAAFELDIREATIECNPGTVSPEKLGAYRRAGFNRVSFGVQSFDGSLLRAIGRIHSPAEAEETVSAAREAGFSSVSVDLMYGLPNQSTEQYIRSIERAAALGVDHISAYSLILEEGTPLYDAVSEGTTSMPDEDETYEMHRAGMKRLEQLGYRRYEISNYAREGFECLHNLNYWNVGEYVGLGLNSSSAVMMDGALTRFKNCSDMEKYIIEIRSGKLPREETETEDRQEEMFEWMMLGLRKIEGVERSNFLRRFGIDACDAFPKAVQRLIEQHWLEVTERFIRLSDRGLDMQNAALLEFME